MIYYKFSFSKPHKQLLAVETILDSGQKSFIDVHLPAWRPGRYELQNFAKNIIDFECFGQNSEPLSFIKINKSTWRISTSPFKTIHIKYNYFATQMDAGGSWLDEELLYVNPINLCLFVEDRLHEPVEVVIELPTGYQIACGKSFIWKENIGYTAHFNNFHELVDMPWVAASSLSNTIINVQGIDYHLWFYGIEPSNTKQLIVDFGKFIDLQVHTMKPVPFEDYHFIFIILPYRHYHGVEHRNSTIITLGPTTDFYLESFQQDLLGISSHELYHAWNICKIRPAELSPYQFLAPAYFETGFVAEGITTYLGDKFLWQSGVYTTAQYLQELNNILKRHLENEGNYHLSLADSSIDLWVDGYIPTAPMRRVSIYDKGCVAAFILDLEIQQHSQGQYDIHEVMRRMWQEFNNPNIGYSSADFLTIVEQLIGQGMQHWYKECILGKTNLIDYLGEITKNSSFKLHSFEANTTSEKYYGIRLHHLNNRLFIEKIDINSPVDDLLAKNDEILRINNQFSQEYQLLFDAPQLQLDILRHGIHKTIHIERTNQEYFVQYSLRSSN